jgi:hypothetical protein
LGRAAETERQRKSCPPCSANKEAELGTEDARVEEASRSEEPTESQWRASPSARPTRSARGAAHPGTDLGIRQLECRDSSRQAHGAHRGGAQPINDRQTRIGSDVQWISFEVLLSPSVLKHRTALRASAISDAHSPARAGIVRTHLLGPDQQADQVGSIAFQAPLRQWHGMRSRPRDRS